MIDHPRAKGPKMRWNRALPIFGAVTLLLVGLVGCEGDPDPVPAPLPPFTAPSTPGPVVVLVPDPTADVSGGGPLSGDADASARIQAQLPSFPQSYELEDSEALAYIGKLVAFLPAMGPAFSAVNSTATCALDYGVVAAKVLVSKDLRAASAMLILSEGQAQKLPQVALSCFVRQVVGGGNTPGEFTPCYDQYYYDATTSGVADRYFVIVAATVAQDCVNLRATHSAFNPQDF
ncbi:hypothetical protein [Rathayibacter caricis]|uniref:hypothetical protein n=1 Tax=Rathayibacter caricis TaxID=110936 RepID=UPI0011B28FE4|nr:hypothetical protein [Rathayibacter caricis]